jgi:hypothetical protein
MISKTLLLVGGSIAVADAFSPSFSQLPSFSVACSMARGSPAIGRRDLLRGGQHFPLSAPLCDLIGHTFLPPEALLGAIAAARRWILGCGLVPRRAPPARPSNALKQIAREHQRIKPCGATTSKSRAAATSVSKSVFHPCTTSTGRARTRRWVPLLTIVSTNLGRRRSPPWPRPRGASHASQGRGGSHRG